MKKLFFILFLILGLCSCGKRGGLDKPKQTLLQTTMGIDNDFGTTASYDERHYPKKHEPIIDSFDNDTTTIQGLTKEALQ